MTITILCARPGFRRAGMAHPARATYQAGSIAAEALALLKAEPLITVIEDDAAMLMEEAGRLALEGLDFARLQLAGAENSPTLPAASAEGHEAQPAAGAVVEPSGGAADPADGLQPPPSDPGSGPVQAEAGEASDADPAKASNAAPPKRSK